MKEILQNKKLLSIISGVIFCVCLIGVICTYNMVNNQNIEYDTVKVKIVNVEKIKTRTRKQRNTSYKVTAEYNSKQYELENVKDSEIVKFMKGAQVDVYEHNGKLFANTDGVKTSTPVSTVYFVFLFGGILFFVIFVSNISAYMKEKKKIAA